LARYLLLPLANPEPTNKGHPSMRSFSSALLCLFTCLASGATARADLLPNLPSLVILPTQEVFAPASFDDNDSAQITLFGELPNTCFKAGPAAAKVDRAAKTIVIRNQSYHYPSCWCLDVRAHYSKTLELGVLPAGRYQVWVEQQNGERKARGTLTISVSTKATPDDHLYAMIEDARVTPADEGAPKTLELTGVLASSCMELSEVKVAYRAPNVIEVLPIVSIGSGATCDQKRRPLKHEVALSPAWKGPTLVHVRSLNGQALNKVVHF
jgi:hypothetical protein